VATRQGKPLLTRADWTRAALEAMATGGTRAVAVDRIAKTLGASRGSFYWHFTDRQDLIDAALEMWEQQNTTEFADEVLAAGEPIDQLRFLLREVYEKPVDAIEITLASAGDDPLVAAAFARVTNLRLDYLRGVFSGMGLDDQESEARAWLVYAFYLGHHELGRNADASKRRPADLDRIVALLSTKRR
jgi:AcrR family transcriptional regulator